MAEQLKNLYSEEFVNSLIDGIYDHYPNFDKKEFFNRVFDDSWESLELKERMYHVTRIMAEFLPSGYEEAVKILMKAAPGIKGFGSMSLPDYSEKYGLEYWELSMEALEVFTKQCSSEFAIRPFIIKYPEKTMEQMLKWSKSDNEHVRRLSSEGCRPRLPWTIALPEFKKNPAPIIPILENLKDDPSEYVRKSVANNLNDISKDNPQITLEIAENWLGKSKNTDWIVKHALRTLLKNGDPKALELTGFSKEEKGEIRDFELSSDFIEAGGELRFSFELFNSLDNELKARVEYCVYYMKSGGKTSRKVFQIGNYELQPGGSKKLKRKQSFKDMTTRKHYPGLHKIGIIVNGNEVAVKQFMLG